MDLYIASLVQVLLLLSIQTVPLHSEGYVNVDSAIAPRVADFTSNLHRLLEGSRIRRKRNIQNIQNAQDPVESEDYQMRVGSSEATHLPYLSDYNLTFWIPVKHNYHNQVLVGTREGYLILFELSQADDQVGRIVSISLQEKLSTKAMAFTHLDEQWFAVLQPSGNRTWIRLYLRVGRGLERRQSIYLEGESDFDLVTVKNVHYLAVITLTNSVTVPGFALYRWMETQFDEIARRDIYGPRSIACWILDGSLYFAVAQEFNEDGSLAVGSSVFLFNSKDDGELVLLQMLATYGPKKVLHFFVSGSHYVIFIGRKEALIYWWANNQFLLWQTIKGTASASDVSTLDLANGEVVIVITLKEEVLFLTLDESGHYIVSFTMKFTGFDLASLQFMYSGESYYSLALFAASLKPHPHPVYKLTLRPYYIPSGSSLDTLRQCLKDVSDMLDERQAEMNNVHLDLSRVWLKDKKQKINTEVIVKGETSSIHATTTTEVIVVIEKNILPDSSISEAEKNMSSLNVLAFSIKDNLSRSVMKSEKQDINGSKHFENSLSIPSLNMESTNIDIPINGVGISRVHRYALRRKGNQTFSYPLAIPNVFSKWITTKNLNDVKISDFLLLQGEQEVTGQLKYSNLFARSFLANSINTIPVDNFVTVGSEQNINDLKSISFLKSSTIDVSGQVNGENLSSIYGRIVTLRGDDTINAKCIFDSTVNIKGDFFLNGYINGDVSIDHLATESVTISTNQDLKGPYVFTSLFTINQDLKVSTVNGINVSSLVTLSTDQTIHGPLKFRSLQINRDLVINFLNGIKLHENAILKTNDPQFVDGFVMFTQQLTADFIDMGEYVTLDGVDPSLLVQDLVRHEEGIVKHNSSMFHNVIVAGNVTVTGGVNGHDVFDLPGSVWLKTTPQVVEIPVHVTKMSVQNEMEAEEVNRLHLDTDVVHTSGDETIISSKSFRDETVWTTHIDAIIGTLINGFDVVTFKNELDNFVDEGTIRGRKVLQSLEIYGDVYPNELNERLVDNLMLPQAFQEVTAQVELPSVLTVLNDDLRSNTVDFKTLNGIDLNEHVSKAVLKTNPQRTVRNKDFANVRAHHLSMQPGSTLDGISFDEMLGRVVTLDTPQEIPSEKSFSKAVHFRSPFSTLQLNGQDLSSLRDVILLDEESSVSALKKFTGIVHAEDVFGLVNGIDIGLLNQAAFLKSEHNEIKSHMTFIGDIEVGNLVADSFVDSIEWKDLIILNKNERLDSIFLPNTAVSNLQVTGLVNGCDLTKLRESALYTKMPDQRIPQEITVDRIQVIGNLNLKSLVNRIPMEDLQKRLITVDGDQIITSNIKLGPDWKVTNMVLGNVINGIDTASIVKDAVRKSVAQDIYGHKSFRNLKCSDLITEQLFVKDQLDGVNMDDLYDNAVLKFGNQIVNGEKIFPSLKADVAVVEGFINGLRLPRDVVLSTTSEHISSAISFMSDLVLLSQLNVHGSIDGVHLDSFLQNRVTLRRNETVSSLLSFNNDISIRGELSVDGTLNNIVLELVSKLGHNIPLDGYKTFAKSLRTTGSITFAAINGFHINDLDFNILRRGEEDFLSDVQIFTSSLKAQSLISETINSISIPGLSTDFFFNWHEFQYDSGLL